MAGAFNGIATAGDYLSASTFLGYAGLMYLFGFDGWIIGLGAMLSFLPVLYLLADRMRNAGKFTVADVLSYRLRRRPVRIAVAINTLLICGIYLTAQLVGAGSLIEALAGISFTPAVLICGIFMVVYVVFGGMLATTWVQIIKAGMLMTAGVVISVAVLAKFNFSPSELLNKAAAEHPKGKAILGPRHLPDHAGAGHLHRADDLHRHGRPAAHPHALLHGARLEGRARVGRVDDQHHRHLHRARDRHGLRGPRDPGRRRRGGRRQGRQPGRAAAGPEPRRRARGRTGGDIALALFSAAAFATILAVVAGLVIAASGAVAHDLWANLSGREDEESERKVARIAAVGVGIAAIVGTLLVGTGFNVTVLVSMAFVFAASANFPPLILALTWRRFNTTGALVGVAFGIVASVVMIVLSPPVWPGPDSQGSPSSLTFPGLVTIPIGFLGCWLGTMLGKRDSEDEHSFDELLVRSETGLGAEGGPTLGRRGRAPGVAAPAREPVA